MDTQLSAFQVYQQQNKKKRVVSPLSFEVQNERKKTRKNPRIENSTKISSVSMLKKKVKVVKKEKHTKLKEGPKDIKKFNKTAKTDNITNGINLNSVESQFEEKVPKKIKNVKKEKEIQKKKKIKKLKSSHNNITNENNVSEDEEEIPILVPIKEQPLEEKKKKLTPYDSSSEESDSHTGSFLPLNIIQESFNPVTQGLALFKWLINPITPKEFFEKYWEKDVLHVERSNRHYLRDIFSTEKLDSILRKFPLHYTRNIDVVAYQNGQKEVINEEGRALPAQLWDYYNNGCSVRVLNPHTYDQNIHSIIASLQEYFGTMVGANVYLTPPDSQGFAPHFDDIEAFVIQLEGSKYWKLYKPKESDVLARDSSLNFNAKDLDAPFKEVKLNAGDILYFPRGVIHEGRTIEEHSLHITISVYQHTAYADLLEFALPAALKKAAMENVEFRKGLPLNYLKHVGVVNKNDKSNKRKLIMEKIKCLMTDLLKYVDVDEAADQLGRKFMHDAMPPLYSQEEALHSCKYDGDFMKNGRVFNRVEITPEVRVRLLRYYALRIVQETSTNVKIYFCTDNAKSYHGEEEQWLEIDEKLIPAMQMLLKKYPDFLVVDSLPVEDETEKLSLISSLWEHGLLVTAEPLPNFESDAESDE
ncbi:hypothetical protein ABEB36_010094 [Hypothenemus hampei]|uniref:Bifunctional lysine-specific demethylase and histidyl-hydroxylase n=1 Tax=Hypothenemus hampei TaxID=57062 RepID=A0ABD1EMM4_HYPHA